MADHAALGARLGHFLPYLLQRRLRAVAWPADGAERTAFLLVLALMVLYGAGFGMLLRSDSTKVADMLPAVVIGLNATVLLSATLVDFVPALRPVSRPVPEHFPVSARLNVVTAFLLDLITLRRLTLAAGLFTAALVAPRYAGVPGFALLLLLGAAALSFNVRLLAALGRWRHPLMAMHLVSLGLLLGWTAFPQMPYHQALGAVAVLLPWLLGALQLRWQGEYFSARYLPAEASAPTETNQLLARLSPEAKAYVRRVRRPLLAGLVFKILLMGATAWLAAQDGQHWRNGYFYLGFLPVFGFNYANSNLFGFLGPLVVNEIQRVGLTARLLGLYARVVGAVVAVDCLVSAVMLVALFPATAWDLLWLLPLSAVALSGLGLWGSLYFAKPVTKVGELGSMRKNVSTLISVSTLVLAGIVYYVPWWWLRLLVVALVAVSALIPVRAVLRNDGDLRRRLWRGIGA